MLIIQVKDGESIDKVLKKYKRKYEKTGILRKLREKQQFVKKSVLRRQEILRAIHRQRLASLENQ